jgi:hypothetical protein
MTGGGAGGPGRDVRDGREYRSAPCCGTISLLVEGYWGAGRVGLIFWFSRNRLVGS